MSRLLSWAGSRNVVLLFFVLILPLFLMAQDTVEAGSADTKTEFVDSAKEGPTAASPSDGFVQPSSIKRPSVAGQPATKGDGSALEGEPKEEVTKPKKAKKSFLEKFLPILILLLVVGVVVMRLPKIELGHSVAFRKRRVLNWLPLGMTYAFLYMARYNIKVSQHAFETMRNVSGEPMMTNGDFATIFGWGTAVYGASFLLNGPLTDRKGGRFAILVGAGGAMVMNLLMGLATLVLIEDGPSGWVGQNFVMVMTLLYMVNMYFQSFGAVAVVKTNAPWFHVNERGVFGAIFGILISLGIYFAFDVGYMIQEAFSPEWLFLTPAVMLSIFWVITFFVVRNTPGEAGLKDFDTADASSGDDGPALGAIAVFKLMLKNPVIMTIACVEFCSGFLRQAIMQWYRTFAKNTDAILGEKDSFVYDNWGMLLCCAGIMGGVVAGVLSDRVFQSRRGPVAAILYSIMIALSVVLVFTFQTSAVGWVVVFMSMSVIGVHGMLSGTASMDFGGRKNVGVAVGIIDGFVYAGTAVMAITYGAILPEQKLNEANEIVGPATDPANWTAWPIAMVPLAVLGFLFALKLWHAKPKPKQKAAEA
jgi:OPA family glycerol-3-phosphate transporter-like MFS transporter